MLRLRPLTAARLRLRPLTVARLPLVFHCRKAPSLVLLAARLLFFGSTGRKAPLLYLFSAARLLFFFFYYCSGKAPLLLFFFYYLRTPPACGRLQAPSSSLRCSSPLFLSAVLLRSSLRFSLLSSALFCSFLLISALFGKRRLKAR